MTESAFQAAWNFLRTPEELATKDRAQAWVLPIPYEGTTCYGAGTRDGPAAILAASRQIEFYDPELDCEPAMRFGIHTLNALAPVRGAPEEMIDVVEKTVADILGGSPSPQILAVLGGEHSLSAGVARGIAHAIPAKNLVAVCLDAHGDLRDTYEGSRFSHACAARRILDVCPLFQAGVRSLSLEEARFIRACKPPTRHGRSGGVASLRTFSATESAAGPRVLEELAKFVRGKNVYLTIDLDGLDPSIMPAVGTPEPGGLSWERALEFVRVVTREAASVPAFDVVELAPLPGMHGPDYLAATLVYKVMSLALLGHKSKA